MNNKELLKQIENLINENERLKKENVELAHLKDVHYNNLKIAIKKIDDLQKQNNNANITAKENLQQLETIEKAFEKKTKIDTNFIKNSISVLLKAMKYSQNDLQQGGSK